MTSGEAAALLARTRDELAAARALEREGMHVQAILHAYYATFFAAEAALLELGETRSKHSGVIGAFGQLVVKTGGVDRATGGVLRRLFELRSATTYDVVAVEPEAAGAAIADAARFVDAVREWLARRRDA